LTILFQRRIVKLWKKRERELFIEKKIILKKKKFSFSQKKNLKKKKRYEFKTWRSKIWNA
jgi:hypothetical protein